MKLLSEFGKLSSKHISVNDLFFSYGTAGFRNKSDVLDPVMFRSGMLAGLRSAFKQAWIGVMITASHNPIEDNGVKVIDPFGEMLEQSWESHATQLANSGNNETLHSRISELISQFQTNPDDSEFCVCVALGFDTRPSSKNFAEAVTDGIKAFYSDAKINNYGLVTTPQLHYIVRCLNDRSYGFPACEGYFMKLSTAFKFLSERYDESPSRNYTPIVHVDAANGIGAMHLLHLKSHVGEKLTISIHNDCTTGVLNEKCGADFAKVNKKSPAGINMAKGTKYCSLDGDADRLVYFYLTDSGNFRLLDGDKIAILICEFMQLLLKQSELQLKLGIIQTAYANGNSTRYIRDSVKVDVCCVPTGVKHLYRAADQFDIAVMFEANGHGTVHFSKEAKNQISDLAFSECSTASQNNATIQLTNLVDLINQATGDAISDMLLVETILHAKGWSCIDWDSCYSDLPNRLTTVKVADRTKIKTTDAERRISSPLALQEKIDALVALYPFSRSFVRPSGTEDLVRVYAEADTQENADELNDKVSQAVRETLA